MNIPDQYESVNRPPYTEPHIPQQRNTHDQSSANVESLLGNMASMLQDGIDRPRPELLHFSGIETEYVRFITNFNLNIDRRVHDTSTKLSYLVQYCEGDARELIMHCTMLPPDEGYKEACDLLRKTYGRPMLVARKYS
ncbi:uncharacterized protein LOC144431221 [Styela clava]